MTKPAKFPAKFDDKAVYSSIGEMMVAAAATAVVEAERQHGFELDYSEPSIAHLDPILAQVVLQAKDADVERETKLWGAYLGETMRRIYGGDWEFTQYPGSATAVPTVLVRGIHAFYTLVKQRIEAQPAELPSD